MARYTQNGGKITYGGLDIGVTSVKFSPGRCADIDVTTSANEKERTYIKGYGEGRTLEVGCLLDDTTACTAAELVAWKDDCNGDTLTWTLDPACEDAEVVKSWTGNLYDYSIDAELDGAVSVTLTFRLTDSE